MTNPEAPPVRVGQVWEDRNPSQGGRLLRIRELVGIESTIIEYAACERVFRDAAGELRVIPSPRPVYVPLSEFSPTASGYRLIADAPAPQL